LEIEEPGGRWYTPAFHLRATLPSMLGTPLIGDQVIEVRQPCKKRLLAPLGMMESFYGEQFPLNSVMGLIQ
jgi:hypothetical protein